MLSRTADSLCWLARYVERADFVARIIDATARLAALPRAYGGAGSEWESALISSGALPRFEELELTVTPENVVSFLVFDARNPSSIRSCVEFARANARSVRTALTSEMWDALNGGWLEMQRVSENAASGIERDELARLLGLVKKMALDVDGSAYRTMLRNDGFCFMRLGHFMERADNTARLLDVKYHVLLPETEAVGGSLDYFQWTSLLRAVSAYTAYHWVYRQSIKPWLVADLLILKPDMPRSLVSCTDNVVRCLDELAQKYGRQGPAQRHARMMLSRLQRTTLDSIFENQLHAFIEAFIKDNDALNSLVAEQYLFQ